MSGGANPFDRTRLSGRCPGHAGSLDILTEKKQGAGS